MVRIGSIKNASILETNTETWAGTKRNRKQQAGLEFSWKTPSQLLEDLARHFPRSSKYEDSEKKRFINIREKLDWLFTEVQKKTLASRFYVHENIQALQLREGCSLRWDSQINSRSHVDGMAPEFMKMSRYRKELKKKYSTVLRCIVFLSIQQRLPRYS